MVFNKNCTPALSGVVLMIITPLIIILVLAIHKLPYRMIIFNTVVVTALVLMLMWILWFSCCTYPIKDCFGGRQRADESRENMATQPVDVERPQRTVQFESARAQRQPHRSTSPWFDMRSLPPVKTFGGECVICREEFKNGDTIQPLAVCIHEFHSSCIQHWFNNGKTTCPLCREDLSTALKTKRHIHG